MKYFTLSFILLLLVQNYCFAHDYENKSIVKKIKKFTELCADNKDLNNMAYVKSKYVLVHHDSDFKSILVKELNKTRSETDSLCSFWDGWYSTYEKLSTGEISDKKITSHTKELRRVHNDLINLGLYIDWYLKIHSDNQIVIEENTIYSN